MSTVARATEHWTSKERLRIAFVCNEYPPGPHGGIGTVTRMLARSLCAAGHEVRSVGAYPDSYPAPEREDDGGVSVLRLKESRRRAGWIPDRWRVFRTVADWARRGEIDLVEVPDWEGWAAGWPRLPVPIVVRLNGSATYFAEEFERPLSRTAFLLERASARRADAWCASSRYVRDATRRLFGLNPDRSEILHNPVETPDATAGVELQGATVVYAGTLTAKKGVESLFAAWPAVVRAIPEARLHVYGKDAGGLREGSMRAKLEAQLDPSLRDTVVFWGHVARAEVIRAYETARVAVFPSFAEAFALTPLEAMSRGCPTVYTRRCSGPELIEDGRDGLLIDPAHPEEIANAICRLLADSSLAARLGDAGRRHVQRNFSIDVLRSRNERFFARTIALFHDANGR